MTDIIRMAREANNGKVRDPLETHMFFYDELERFAALVAAHERGVCEGGAELLLRWLQERGVRRLAGRS